MNFQAQWGPSATPQPDLANRLYGGRNLDSATNIVFSNGLLDPWSSGGVLKSSETKGGVVAIIIPEVRSALIVKIHKNVFFNQIERNSRKCLLQSKVKCLLTI